MQPVMAQLGAMHAASFAADPSHLGFVLSRYKHTARLLFGQGSVLEVGCGDTTGARVVSGAVSTLIGIDRQLYPNPCIKVFEHDMLDGPFGGPYDAVYALDVLEHVHPDKEDLFLGNITACFEDDGVFICGMPSLESQPYASEISLAHHVNCKTRHGLRKTLKRHFRNVFPFGINDETLHTGFGPFCQYRLALCTGPLT